VFGSILHRMILAELVKVFLLSLLGLTGLLLLAGIIAEASQRGLGPGQILALIPLIIPSTLPYTIPATTLFATSLVYGRLAADSEITAIKAAGIHIFYIIWPCLLLGGAMSAVTMGLYYHVIPYTHTLMKNLVLKDVEELLYSMLRQERCINHPKLNYAIWVNKVQGRRLLNPVFKRRDVKGDYDLIAHAQEAELRYDITNSQLLLHMYHGVVFSKGSNGHAYFQDHIWEVPIKESPLAMQRPRRPGELTWTEIYERRAEILHELEDLGLDIVEAKKQADSATPPPGAPLHLAHLTMKAYFLAREGYALRSELQQRPALALGCFCFVLVGCPVGIWFSRSDYLSSFITCFLPIVFVYYPLMLCGSNIAKEGKIHPIYTVWVADLLLALIALPLFWKLQRN
jgi:lipopolysaccharide export system permease protein